MSDDSLVPYLVSLGVSCVVLLVVYLRWRSVRAFVRRSIRVEGTIVELIPENDCYAPVVDVSTEATGLISKRMPWASNPPVGQVGDIKQLLLDPDHPDDFRFAGEWSLYTGMIAFGVVGVLGLVISVVLLLAELGKA